MIVIKALLLFIWAFYLTSYSQAQEIRWEETAPGIWKGTVGTPEEFDLLKVADVSPKSVALERMTPANFPLNKELIVAELNDRKTYLRFPLEKQEQLFGFGLNFKTVHQRGSIKRLHVDHYGGVDNGRTHAPVPFFLSSFGYGVLINSARYLDVYAGTASRKDSPDAPEALDRNTDENWTASPYSDAVEILVPAEGVEIYVFAGPTPLEAVRRYNLFQGGGPLPPRWGLGFTQRVHRLYSDKDVMNEVKEFEEREFPLDFIGLEPGWQSKSYPNTFAWDQGRFPDPVKFTQDLLKKGIRLNLWVNPYVSPEAEIYAKILPYTASHTVWAGAVPDLSLTQAQQIFWQPFRDNHVGIGVSGYKIDEVDGYDRWLWPDVARFPSALSAEQMRQAYGLFVKKQSTALFREKNLRTYGLVRASNAGGTSFPYVIYNDYYDHRDFITALINSGFSGILWTPEARASKTAEEWLRRMQTVIFSPMAMINAWASGTKPWSFPEVEQEVREMAKLRMQMMPYWYTSFALYHFEGIPPFRAMNLEEGFDDGDIKDDADNAQTDLETNPYEEALKKEVKDQYMAGPFLLVAPVFAGETSREVILPKGDWYDFYDGHYVGNGELIQVKATLDKIPVYVRDGGIIPLMAPRLHAPTADEKVELEIRHYGTQPNTFQLYDDDGTTYDYEEGVFSWREIKVTTDKKGNWKGEISKAEKGQPDTIGKITWKFMTEQP